MVILAQSTTSKANYNTQNPKMLTMPSQGIVQAQYNSVPASGKEENKVATGIDALSISPAHEYGAVSQRAAAKLEDVKHGEDGGSDDDFEHLIFDIEEVECKMTDIEERERIEDDSRSASSKDHGSATGGAPEGRSVRGSILHSPKHYQFDKAARMSELSILSSIANQHQLHLSSTHSNHPYYSNNPRALQDILRYDADRALDVSMTSMYSTPRHHHNKEDQLNDSQMDMMSQHSNQYQHTSGLFSPHVPRGGVITGEGRVNSQADAYAMTPRLHQQNSVSSHRVGLNDSQLLSRGGYGMPSERSSMQMQRSSAEQSEIDRELNRHKRNQNSLVSSYEKNHHDPEALKKSMQQQMQLQLQALINKISEKEKLFAEQEAQYAKYQEYLAKLEAKTSKLEAQLKDENNLNSSLRTQINFLLQTNFGPGKLTQKLNNNFYNKKPARPPLAAK